MSSIGHILKQEREARGVSLSDVHAATKITLQNLEALEEERFDSFPNRVYTRAFLRDYANFLGLDSGALLERYEQEWGSPRKPEPPRTNNSKSADGAASLIRAFSILIILVIVGLATVKPITKLMQRSANPKPAPVAKADIDTTPRPNKPVASVEASKPDAPSQQPGAQQGVNLTITATEVSWLRVRVDGKQVFEGAMRPSQQMSWQGKKNIAYRTGNAGGLRLKLDGKDLPSLGKRGAISKGWFTAPPAAPGNSQSPPQSQPIQ